MTSENNMSNGGQTNLEPYDLREKANETLLKLAGDIRNVWILEDSMANNSKFENNTTTFFENTLDICENAKKQFDVIKDKYYKNNYEDGGMMSKGGSLPNPDNLYALMELDEESGYGSLVDERVYTAQGAREKKYDLEDNNLVKEGFEIKIFTVSELLRRKSLPKQSKQNILDNYDITKKMIDDLRERFEDYEWKVDFKAKGGKTSDLYYIELNANDPKDKDLNDVLKKYNVKMKIISFDKNNSSPFESGEIRLIGEKNDIINVLKNPLTWDASENDLNEFYLKDIMKMEDGGYMAKGGEVTEQEAKEKLVKLRNEEQLNFSIGNHGLIFMSLKNGNKKSYDNYKKAYEHYLNSKGGYMEDGGYMAKGGSNDFYENLQVHVQGVGTIYHGKSMKAAISKAKTYLSKNPKAEIVIVDEKYGDEYDLEGNQVEYKYGGYMAKGGMMSDEKMTLKLQKEFEGKDLFDDEIVDEYVVKQFDYSEDDDKIEKFIRMKKNKFYVVPFDNQDDSYYYILVPKDKMAKGGKLKSNAAKFSDKVKAISKKLVGTKVPKKYKKDYGSTYDKQEANTAARRISGAKLAELKEKLAKKNKTKKK